MELSTRDRWLAVNYAATIFVSAFLLFQVQPLVSKHILPWFGGSPAVWTACMLFFQAVLFAGYAYAHASQSWLRPAMQAVVQLVMIGAAVVFLHVLPDESWAQGASGGGGGEPVGRILLMLALTVGLPFLVLSSTAPLVQAWYAQSFPDRVPYRLYALSNLGSLVALLSYPLVFERVFDLPQQARFWSWGFWAYAVLCGVAAVRLWREGRSKGANAQAVPGKTQGEPGGSEWPTGREEAQREREARHVSPTWGQRAAWLLLPAFATVALLATTNHVCTDIAVMPLLWVVPLALYLITFIIAFDHPRWYRPTWMAGFTLAAIYGAALVSREGLGRTELYDWATTGRVLRMLGERLAATSSLSKLLPPQSPEFHFGFFAFIALNFAAMFGVCLLCHGELVRRRPHSRYLTSFYLMIAAGGMLGGVAVSLVAPQVFRTLFEWQLFMFLGCVGAAIFILHALIDRAFPSQPARAESRSRGSVWWPLAALLLLLSPLSLVFVDLAEYLHVSDAEVKLRLRNFFGTLAVREKNIDSPLHANVLYHGTTAHGSQFLNPERRNEPATYYSPASGVGRALNFYHGKKPELDGLRIGAVGLGTGTLACYVAARDLISFYEINQAVIDITESGRWFTFLEDSRGRGGDYRIKRGDARLVLENELRDGQPREYHVLVLDAFSGDAIPVHLLTVEAFEVYERHLSTHEAGGIDGAIAVHISNRYLDLEPVVRAIAEMLGFAMVHLENAREPDQFIYASEWVILSRNEELIGKLARYAVDSDGPLKPAVLWTDGRSSLFDVAK